MSRNSLRIFLIFATSFAPFPGGGYAATPEQQDSRSRDWTDSTGRFHTKASLIGVDDAGVRLRKSTGVTISVGMSRLSVADQQFASQALKLAAKAADVESTTTSAAAEPAMTGLVSAPMGLLKSLESKLPTETKSESVAKAVGQILDRPLLSKKSDHVPENMIYVRVSAAFLKRMADQDVWQTGPVRDNILGTNVAGDSETVGRMELELQPNDRAAVGIFRLTGRSSSQTVGDAGPVQIMSHGIADFQSVKSVWVDRQGIHFGPATTTAKTNSTISGITTSLPRLRGRIALRIASNRVAETHEAANIEAAQHVSRRVSRGFDRSAAEKMAALWRMFGEQVATLPVDDPLRPREWQASSCPEMIQLVAIGAPNDGSGYVPAPDSILGTADVQIDIHVAVVKKAISDVALTKALKPTVVLMASMKRPQSTEVSQVQWSEDHSWLSITWKPAAEPVTAGRDRVAGSIKSALEK